jgi:hypothetical protein
MVEILFHQQRGAPPREDGPLWALPNTHTIKHHSPLALAELMALLFILQIRT